MADRLFCLLVRLSAQEPPNSSPRYSVCTAGHLALDLDLLCLGVGLRYKSLLTGLAFLKVMMCWRKQPGSIFLLKCQILTGIHTKTATATSTLVVRVPLPTVLTPPWYINPELQCTHTLSTENNRQQEASTSGHFKISWLRFFQC